MGLMSWSWLKKEVLSHRRRESAPPTSAVNYDPNANREQYLQAFDEFKQRGSLYNQLTIREESEENDSQSTDTAGNKVTNENDGETSKHYSKSGKAGKTVRRSLPNKMSRSSLNGSSHKKTNTPNSTLIIPENNNTIYVNEIIEFEGKNCMNDTSFGATDQSPPKTFYRNNSNPFPSDGKKPEKVKSETSAQKPHKTLEESRQRACGKLLRYIRPKAKTDASSSSSGEYKQYDLEATLSDDDEIILKKSNGQDIPIDVYDEIVNVLGNVVTRNASYDPPKHQMKQNSPTKPSIVENGISGISQLSEFASFRRCEGVVDDNFGFLNDTEWNYGQEDENESDMSDDQEINVEEMVPINQHDKSDLEEENIEVLSEIDSLEQWSRNVDSTMSPQESQKHPIYIIECKAKDIKPKTSVLRNTIVTPFDFSSGSFRKTTVTLKKCCPRDSASIRLVEEAIERDYEILSKVKHPNIVILMAACFHRKLINHMTLVLEPVDYTLNYYLHQLDKSFTILEAISITQQISSAALYLQECGYIHSNISSHNVLVRERPWSVKLSSFELATDVDCSAIRAEVEINYPQLSTGKFSECLKQQEQSTGPEDDDISLKEQYMEMSKRPPTAKRSPNGEHEYMPIPSKYLIYDTVYRQRLSMHNFLAPELLSIDQRFVFPTTKTDVYSLCLLLWEILNQCVPFAVYSRLDMERMIATKKLNLPFFERERCRMFMDIFRVGLAVKLENRSIDVPHLIEMLEDIELEILTGGEDASDEANDGDVVERVHSYVNYPRPEQTDSANDVAISYNSNEPERLSGNGVNSTNDFILSPSLLDFDRSLSESERTSTKKLKRKPARKLIKNQIREIFATVDEVPEVVSDEPSFEVLNESFLEMSNDFRRQVSDDIGADEKLSKNLAVIAEDIRRNILNDTDDVVSVAHQSKNLHSRPSMEQRKQTFQQQQKTPAVVGFSIKAKTLNDSKTHGNFLEAPVRTAGAAKSLFNSKVDSSSAGYNCNIQENDMPKTPIARQNYIRRNAWLLNQQPSSTINETETERMVKANNKDSSPTNDDKKVNVSVRIVHNKITPKKSVGATDAKPMHVDEGRPSILSKIKFFNSASETSKTDLPPFSDKYPSATASADEVVTNNNFAKRSEKIVNRGREYDSGDNNLLHSTNERKTIVNELKDAVLNLQKSPLDQPQQKFEKKLWKRELDICNRSLNSSEGGNDSKTLSTRFRSVRDTIMKFEKRGEVTRAASYASPSESMPKTNGVNQQSQRKLPDSPTLIKRTIYSERILSGVDLSPIDNRMPMFDKFNFGSQQVASRMSLRQVRQTSSDVVGVTKRRQMSAKSDVRRTICGSERELLSFNAGTFNSPEVGPSSAVTKYVCFNCASQMSSDELKALTFESVNTSGSSDQNALEESPTRRCQARVKTQNTRSIEDLYIDDDFVHELGANMELQSDCSDLLDFDMLSSEIFNSRYNAADNKN